jgi:hypothetical protein
MTQIGIKPENGRFLMRDLHRESVRDLTETESEQVMGGREGAARRRRGKSYFEALAKALGEAAAG